MAATLHAKMLAVVPGYPLAVIAIPLAAALYFLAPTFGVFEAGKLSWAARLHSPDDQAGLTRRARTRENVTVSVVLDFQRLTTAGPGEVRQPVPEKVLKSFQQWASEGRTERVLTLLALTDPRYFDTPANGGVSQMRVDLRPFLIQGQPASTLGRADIPLRTRETTGTTEIGISIWDASRPLGELILPVAIGAADPPPIGDPSAQSLSGIDSLRAAFHDGNALPDAALQLVEIESGRTLAVLHAQEWERSRFAAWPLTPTGDVVGWVQNAWAPNLSDAMKPEALLSKGESLFNRLFPPGDGRKEFIALVNRLRERRKREPAFLPSLFVRMRRNTGDALATVPLGLMRLPGDAEPLGQTFRIDSPLEKQDYDACRRCAAHWVALVPPKDVGLDDVEEVLAEQLKGWSTSGRIERSIAGFKKLFSASDTPWEPTILGAISHYSNDSLYFDKPEGDTMMSSDVLCDFSRPSIALLAGCGTAANGKLDLMRALNARGVETVIATASSVSPRFSASFVKEFDLQMRACRPGSPVAELFHGALEALSRDADEAAVVYGPRSHLFVLLGNGNAQICAGSRRNP